MLVILDIMIPYYGDVRQMQQAVESVIGQDDPRWRLTVVDDGTAEGVPEWFAGLDHPQVRYQRNDRNLGVTGNFQKCVDLAEHDYLVLMGCDDVMLPNYVSCVLSVLEQHPDATMVQPGVTVIDSAGQPSRTLIDSAKERVYAPRFTGTTVMSGEQLAVSLLRGNWLYFPSLCWRREKIQKFGFDPNLHIIQDLALILQLVEDGGKLVVTDTPSFLYRRHAVSASSAGAISGSRFAEAQRFFLATAAQMQGLGWHRAASAARRHVSSRIHALTMIPTAVRQRNSAGVRTLLAYALKRPI